MANRRYTSQFVYSFHKKLTQISVKYTVASTSGAGVTGFPVPGAGNFGTANTSVVTFGGGVYGVTGYSSAPAAGNVMGTGCVQIQMQDNYLAFFGATMTFISPPTGSNVNLTTGLTAGKTYVITAVGTSTTANWVAVGLPVGVPPAVGVAFVASTATPGTGTGTVKALTSSNIIDMEVAGDPNLTLNPQQQQMAANQQGFNTVPGGYLLFNYYGLPASGQIPSLVQPPDGTIVELNLFLNGP